MNNSTFIEMAEKVGLEKSIALSAIKWYSGAINEDGAEVVTLLYELSTFFDTVTCCKRLKMYAVNRIERGKHPADIETFKGIIDAIIENNGNEGRSEKSRGCESIQEMYENGVDMEYAGHGNEKNENMIIFDRMIYYIKSNNIDCNAVINSRSAEGQKNRREIKGHIARMIAAVGCADLNLHITAETFCRMSQLAIHGYLAA